MMKFRLLLLSLVIVSAFFAAGCFPSFLQVKEEYHQTVQVEEGTTIELINRNGKVNISSWSQDYVDIVAIKRSTYGQSELDKVNINVTAGKDLLIETEYLSRLANVSVSYEVRVPEGVTVASVKSSNGSITLKGVKGASDVETSNGSIEIRDVDGVVYARTSNGKINISGTPGIREARTSNGSISAELMTAENDVQIKTSNGSIKLYLADNLDIELQARTSNGKIKAEGLNMSFREMSNKNLSGTMGAGTYLLDVTTSNGSIDFLTLR